MTNTFTAVKMLLLISIAGFSGCVTIDRNQRTPYTVIQPDADYYFDESDERTGATVEGSHESGALAYKALKPPTRITPLTIARRSTSPSTSLSRPSSDYRKQAAEHVYTLNKDRIYQGVLPPLLQAIGVMEVTVDSRGQIIKINWLRKPNHVPAVARQMENIAKGAAPYPSPANRLETVFTETWLWHESGKFQLHSLTEGQSDGEVKKLSGRLSSLYFL